MKNTAHVLGAISIALLMVTGSAISAQLVCDPDTDYHCATGKPTTDPGPRLCTNLSTEEDSARHELFLGGVKVDLCPCAAGQVEGCTEVWELQKTFALQDLLLLQQNYGSPLIITGGNETDSHADTSYPYTHVKGFKVDVVDEDFSLIGLDSFIPSNFFQLVPQGYCANNLGPNYGDGLFTAPPKGGPCFTREPSHWDLAFPENSATSLQILTAGTGSGVVTSSLGSHIIVLCASGAATGCYTTLTHGIYVTLTAVPSANSLVSGWTGCDPDEDHCVDTSSAFVVIDQAKIITAEFDDRGQPPPDDPGCWIPTATGWTWNYPACPKGPPANGGAKPADNGHCWSWNAVSSSWIATRCGGNCVTQSGTPATLNFGGCNPTGTHTAILVVGAHDPNDKSGSEGVGQSRFISGATPLRYAISFDNDLTATAPARTVEVTDPLPSPNLDLSTFALGPIFVAGQFLTPPTGAQHYSTTIDLRPSKNMLLGVNAGLNPATGAVTFAFASLDANTHAPIADPTTGFLAPGDLATVFFTVMPKGTVPTNNNVQNQATVIFDANAPVPTPTWSNALDFTPPLSHVNALPAQVSTPTFVVNWVGSDIGAGVKDYTVYVSIDGAPFAIWQKNTTSTQASFLGATGHAYAFYSIGRDLVDNVEQPKTAAEASTTVGQGGSPGDVNGDGQVDCVDVAVVKESFGKRSGDPTFDARADINGDGVVDIRDLAFVSQHLPAGTHCP